MRKFIFGAIFFALAANHSLAEQNDCNISSIKLLEGYALKHERGIDSYPGSIAKQDGLTIDFDIGRMAGSAASPQKKNQFAWFQTLVIDDKPVCLAMTKPDEKGSFTLLVTFSANSANFSTKVLTPSAIGEALTMILTYRPPSSK